MKDKPTKCMWWSLKHLIASDREISTFKIHNNNIIVTSTINNFTIRDYKFYYTWLYFDRYF